MIQERIAALRIRLASPEQILDWSSGEVTKAETINFRTHKPEKDGLFDERIFGPTRDWTCFCRKYTREQQPGLVCEKCGVEVTLSRVRRERLGHIRLAAPVVHPWFARGTPSIVSLLLNISRRACASVLSYTDYLVLTINEEVRAQVLTTRSSCSLEDEQGLHVLEQLAVGDYLEESAYQQLSRLCPSGFHAETGAAAIRARLEQLDLVLLSQQLHAAYHHAEDPAKKRLFKRLSVVEAFRRSGVQPEWMVLTVLPVLPPGLRPLVPLAGNRMVTADLNELYMRVLHRSDRVRTFEQRDAPAILLHQEKRMLQQAVDAVLDNAHRRRPTVNARRQPLTCLTALLSGKSGRFRQNLLGKRVDYSGRSVIVGNPALHLHQCGLPKKMACELFKPFLMRKLVDRTLARSVKHAKHLVERRDPVIWDLLAECLFERVVLLNRAPTLHRLSIQAFEPVLVEGSALQLHPQVCSSFNADFDGDQMAVHLPLSEEAQDEARALLLSTHNLRSPASGDPAITISQEQVLGLYYLTEDRPSPKRAGRVFVDIAEAIHALEAGVIDLHTHIVIRLGCTLVYESPERASAHASGARGRVETTVGRLLFNEALPDGLRYKNYAMTKDALKQLVAECLAQCGDEATVQLCDALKSLGFHYATRSGISFAISDINMPPQREGMIQQGQHRQQETDERYHAGEISDAEWYRLAIANWTEVTDQISGTLKDVLAPYGSLMTIVKSGATKAKFQQIRQLSGIRGLMASPSGKIIPIPILSNYLLGMSVWEVFIAASGARKGFMDRSLNTAMSGYLTRKLVEVGMSTLITEGDCGTTRGIFLSIAQYQERGATGLRTLLTGRVLAEPVAGLDTGTQLSVEQVDRLLTEGIAGVSIRSPLTCLSPRGLCQQCYGRDPASGRLVRQGAAVGVIAGQSIGEPGTQLTMRTFHSGGIANAQGDITQGLPRVSELFEARTPRNKAILAELAGQVQISSDDGGKRKRVRVVAATSFADEYPLPVGATVLVNETDEVQAGQPLARTQGNLILARDGGRVVQRTEKQLTLHIQECEERVYDLPIGCQLAVEQGQLVEIGTPLTVGAIDPKALLALCGVEATSRYLVGEVQRVYRATGVYISEQHPEIIVRHMLRYVQVSAEGDTDLLPGAVLDQFRFAEANAHVLAQGGQPALARQIILGLTRTALQTTSWIAAASFQETPRVLTAAAIAGQCDRLEGLKEKIILGLPIPPQVESDTLT